MFAEKTLGCVNESDTHWDAGKVKRAQGLIAEFDNHATNVFGKNKATITEQATSISKTYGLKAGWSHCDMMREIVQNMLDSIRADYVVDVHESRLYQKDGITVYSFHCSDSEECVGTVQLHESTAGVHVYVTQAWKFELNLSTLKLASFKKKNGSTAGGFGEGYKVRDSTWSLSSFMHKLIPLALAVLSMFITDGDTSAACYVPWRKRALCNAKESMEVSA